MTQPTLVLASSSPYRQRLLGRLRVPFVAHQHQCDEGQPLEAAVRDIPLELARRKAASLQQDFPGHLILGSDQVAIVGGELLGKPGDRDGARGQLQALSGRTHELITAVALLSPDGQVRTRVAVNEMAMRPLDESEIERYLDADEPYDCCGSYKVESLGISLFASIAGDDFTAIEGLPLIAVAYLLRDVGFDIP